MSNYINIKVGILIVCSALLSSCTQLNNNSLLLKNAETKFAYVNSQPMPKADTCITEIPTHIKAHKDVPLPELLKLECSKPLKFFEFNNSGEIIFSGWAVEVAIPTKALTTTHTFLDDSDRSFIFVMYTDGKIISSTYTKDTLLTNDKEEYAYTKYMRGYILNEQGKLYRAHEYGAILNNNRKLRFFRDIDYNGTKDKTAAKNEDTATNNAKAETSSNTEKLKELKQQFEQGLITEKEYSNAKKKLLGI